MCRQAMSQWNVLAVAAVVAAFISAIGTVGAWIVAWKAAKETRQAGQLKLKIEALREYKVHAHEGLIAVFFAFSDSGDVRKTLCDYVDAIGARKDNPVSYSYEVPCDVEGMGICQMRSHLTVQTMRNRRQNNIDKLYDRVVEAMCESVKHSNCLAAILGFSSHDLANRWKNPL